jgi:hypothetical protein
MSSIGAASDVKAGIRRKQPHLYLNHCTRRKDFTMSLLSSFHSFPFLLKCPVDDLLCGRQIPCGTGEADVGGIATDICRDIHHERARPLCKSH